MGTKKGQSKPHPESLKEVNSLKLTTEITSFVNDLAGEIEEEDGYRKQWAEAIDKLDRLRYGIRRKKMSPWPGCANYSMPLIDSDISRLKPSYVNLIKVSPVVVFEPYGPEDVEPARKRECLYDWRLKNKVKFFKPYCYGVDQVLGAPGQTVFRIIWKFTTRTYTEEIDISELSQDVIDVIYDARMPDDVLFKILEEELNADLDYKENEDAIRKAIKDFRNGKTILELTLYETKDDQPELIACNVKDDLVVPKDTKEINDARFIDYSFWITKNDLKIAMRDGKYEEYVDYEIDGWANTDKRETCNDEMILMHETCCWYDVNNDGIKERCITTWPDAQPESVLRFIELPYDHGMWPYVQIKRELTEAGFYSTRGIPYLDEDFQIGISTAVNQAIDNGTIVNNPERVARKGILSNPNNRRYIPGELTEINGSPAEYETRQLANSSQPVLLQQAQYLKQWSGERFGQQTTGLSGGVELPGNSMGGKKTAREIDALISMQGNAQSLDLVVFQAQMGDVHYQIDALYEQFGSDEEEIITNQKPMKVSRQEIQGRFNIIPNGRMDNADPGMRLKKSMSAFQIGFQNPVVKQDELIKMVMRDIDERWAQILIKTPQEIQAEQQKQMAMQQATENSLIHKQVITKKVSDDLEVRKAILMAPIEGKKYAAG